MSQIVEVFQGGYDLYDDKRMGKKIQDFAEENNYTIELISYSVGMRNGYAMVVFKTKEQDE